MYIEAVIDTNMFWLKTVFMYTLPIILFCACDKFETNFVDNYR